MESDKAWGLNTFNINITWSPQGGGPSQPEPADIRENQELNQSQKLKGGREIISNHSEWLSTDIR